MPNIPQATRDKLAHTGAAMTNGSYPIRNKVDLENAYKDWIRTGRNKAVAAHIAARAKALGLPNPADKESKREDKGETEKGESYDSVIEKFAARHK